MSEQSKKTILYDQHKALNARIVEFGGWLMPISYKGVIEEHKIVREACGLFDVSHMGELFVSGPDAGKFLQMLTINDIGRLKPGKGQYTAILNDQGGMIDDLIIYQIADNDYLICANASNTEKDFSWLKKHQSGFEVEVKNRSTEYSQIAVQGPESLIHVEKLVGQSLRNLDYMEIIKCNLFGEETWIARTGYTGEFGFELYCPNEIAAQIWQALIQSGAMPIGLGARDSLRLEAGLLLYGNDMDETVSPLEAGIGWVVKLTGDDFIGKNVLVREKEMGSKRRMIGFKLEEPGVARHDMAIYFGDSSEAIGKVTSGTMLPTLGFCGGMAMLKTDFCKDGLKVNIDVRGKRKVASLVKMPLYKAKVR